MKFLDPLVVTFDDGRCWTVQAPFDYAVGAPDGSTVVHIPAGFVTDFASIPKVFWNILPPTGWYGKAAVVHDFLYQFANINGAPISRKYADDTLAECMRVLSAAALLDHGSRRGEFRQILDHEIIYWGVRAGGWPTWNAYRRKSAHARNQED